MKSSLVTWKLWVGGGAGQSKRYFCICVQTQSALQSLSPVFLRGFSLNVCSQHQLFLTTNTVWLFRYTAEVIFLKIWVSVAVHGDHFFFRKQSDLHSINMLLMDTVSKPFCSLQLKFAQVSNTIYASFGIKANLRDNTFHLFLNLQKTGTWKCSNSIFPLAGLAQFDSTHSSCFPFRKAVVSDL